MANGTPRRVVVTGLGATTPLGGDLPSSWKAALEGRSGARTIQADWLDKYELPVTFAAQLAVPTTDTLTKVEARRLDPSGQMALVAGATRGGGRAIALGGASGRDDDVPPERAAP